MEQHILDSEKFNLVKELASIHDNINTGRNALTAIKKETDDYIKEREREAKERVEKVLQASHDALVETRKNHEALSSYRQEVTQFADICKQILVMVSAMNAEFKEKMVEADRIMQERYEDMQLTIRNAKIERTAIEQERTQLRIEKIRIEEETRLLADRRGVLQRGFDELKRLQQNK